jgi:flagellar biosynthesis/type III secretory pathway chaperone
MNMETKSLEETLSNQLQLFEELHCLLERETGELAGMNLEAMAEINRRKGELSERIETNSISLRQKISMIASELGLAADVTLGAVAAAMGKKGDIPQLRQKLAAAAQRVQETAAVNGTISECFVRSADMALGFLGCVVNRSRVYGANGGYLPGSSVSVMCNREA